MRYLLIPFCLLFACFQAPAQVAKVEFHPTARAGLLGHISTFKNLNARLREEGFKENGNPVFIYFGLGYNLQYKSLALSTMARYATNITQYSLDWEIAKCSYSFPLNSKMLLRPGIGYGVLYMPLRIQSDANSTQNSLNGLKGTPNGILINNGWGYWDIGCYLTAMKNKDMTVSVGLSYLTSFAKSAWRNGKVELTDIPGSALNAINFELLFQF